MNILILKHELQEELSQFTIDDFYANNQLDFLKPIYEKCAKKLFKSFPNEYLLGLFVKKIIKQSIVIKHCEFDDQVSSLNYLYEVIFGKTIIFSNNDISQIQLEDRKCHEIDLVLPYFNSKNIIPQIWREILYEVFSNAIWPLSGSISMNFYGRGNNLIREVEELTNVDISCMLATKIALQFGHSLTTYDNKINLGLPGGILASISFRKKGKIISSFQKNNVEIFSNCLQSERFVLQTLYEQNGYVDSRTQFKTPGGYYLIENNWVIEINYQSAPILLECLKYQHGQNLSSYLKLEDEEASKKSFDQHIEDEQLRYND